MYRNNNNNKIEPPRWKTNQRTNGPVNAHLRPEIYTNKLV